VRKLMHSTGRSSAKPVRRLPGDETPRSQPLCRATPSVVPGEAGAHPPSPIVPRPRRRQAPTPPPAGALQSRRRRRISRVLGSPRVRVTARASRRSGRPRAAG
jgi:hypothetical protein